MIVVGLEEPVGAGTSSRAPVYYLTNLIIIIIVV